MGLKTRFLPHHFECRCGQRRPWRYWKLLGMKLLIKYFKERGVAPATMLPTQRSRRFPKPKKSVSFGILGKGVPHENFLESLNFRKGWKWHNLNKMRCWWRWGNGKVAVNNICWVMSIFIFKICSPKWALKTAFYRNIWNADAGQRRPLRHWMLLGMKLFIKYFKESDVAPEVMLPTQRSRRFP